MRKFTICYAHCQLVLVIAFLLVSQIGSLNGQTTVTIGSTTTYQTNAPFTRNFNYGWSKMIYLQSEINNAGNITHIAFENDAASVSSWTTQKIYMRHTSATTETTARPTATELTNNWTLVYDGTIDYNTAYKTIDITDFAYNNTDNLEIYYLNYKGSNSTSGPQFRRSGTTNRFSYYRNDTKATFDANTTGALVANYINIKLTISPPPTTTIGSITTFGNQCINTTSAEKNYNVSGSNLTSNIAVKAPSGFEISTTSGSGFVDSLSLAPSSGSVNQTVYVRFKPTLGASYLDSIRHTTTGASTKYVALSGTGINTSAPTGSTSQTFCQNISPTVASLVATGTSIQWYSASSGGSPLATSVALTNNLHYYASQTENGCESTNRLDVTVTLTPNPTAAVISAPTNGATDVSINADVSWSSGGNTTSYDVYFGTTSPGDSKGNQVATLYDFGTMLNSTQYFWRIDAKNSCATTTGTIWSFTTEAAANPPVVTSLASTSGCVGSSVVINGTDLGGATSVTIGGTAVTSITSNTATQIVAVVGTSANGVVTVTTTYGSDASDETFTIYQYPSTANAGADQSACTTTTLNGNNPTTGVGTWTLVSGSGTITSENQYNSGLTNLGVGSNTFRWTIVNGPCAASVDEVVITGYAIPTTATAGTDQNICGSTSATLAGNNPTIGTGTWTLVNGSGTITSPNTYNSGVTGLGEGINTFKWTIANGECTSTSDEVIISSYTTPTTATAGTDQNVCGTTSTLEGNNPTVGSGTWTLVSGAGTITSASSYNSGITDLGLGANTFRWTISNGTCTASTDDVVLTGYTPPTTANAGSDQSVNITTATLDGNNPSVGTGVWTLTSGTGTITSSSTYNSGITGLGAGENIFTWTITNGICTSTDEVSIVRSTEGEYTANGTFSVPCGVSSITVECWGAGGGGGGASGGTGSTGQAGGGGGGAYASKVVSVVAGENYNVTVGVGGNGGATGANSGSVGTSSSFGSSIVVATGGTGGGGAPVTTAGFAGSGADTSSCIGDVKYPGGNGAAGKNTVAKNSGGGGGAAGSSNNGGAASLATGGLGGVSGGGNGANGTTSAAGDGVTPSGYGGGGSGAYSSTSGSKPGGKGANGFVKISYTYSSTLKYKSIASGDWNSTSTWNSSSDGVTWNAATCIPDAGNSSEITISSGTVVTLTASISVDQFIIASGGELIVNASQTFTVLNGSGTDMSINGTLTNIGTVTLSGTNVVNNGGIYNHAINGGTIPTLTWNNGSTCKVTGATSTPPSGTDQLFHHFTWDCSGQSGTLCLNRSITTNGDFTIETTNSNWLTLQCNSTQRTMNIYGDFKMNGGSFAAATGDYLPIINLYGSLYLTAGAFSAYNGVTSVPGYLSLNFKGNNSSVIKTQLNLDRYQTKWDVTIDSGRTITMLSNFDMGATNSGGVQRTFTVKKGATLNMGSYIIKNGSGTISSGYEPKFTLETGATLKTGHASGISTTATGAVGSVQVTGARSYHTSANYVYNGLVAQVTGNALTTTNNLTFDNTSGVTLTNDVTVGSSGILYLTSGVVNAVTNSKTLYVSNTNNNAINGGSATAYVKGKLKRLIPQPASGVFAFPVGTGVFNQLELVDPVTATAAVDITVQQFDIGTGGTFNAPITGVDSKYWEVTESTPANFTNATIRITDNSLNSSNVIGYCATKTGVYNSIGGGAIGTTISSTSTSDAGFFVIATNASSDATTIAQEPVAQVVSGDVRSNKITEPYAVSVFNFKIKDQGNPGDGKSTATTQIVIKKLSGDAVWTDCIAGASLYDGVNKITTGTAVITNTEITIPIVSGNLIVANGVSKELTLKIWLRSDMAVSNDNKTMVFFIDYDNPQFIANTFGSTYATTFGSADIVSNTMTISVVNYDFTNNTVAVENSYNASLERTITVSGLPTSLGSGEVELTQVDLNMGDQSEGTHNLGHYTVILRSPTGIEKPIILTTTTFPNSTMPKEFKLKLRDHQWLRFPITGDGAPAQPWDVGYYRTPNLGKSVGDFASYNGTDPNGDWKIIISETDAKSGISFKSAKLYFSLPYSINNMSSSSVNDACSTPIGICSEEIYVGSNSGYTNQGSDVLNVPCCAWNAARNNSAWYKFKAGATGVKFTVSGVTGDLQIIGVANASGTLCSEANYSIVNGGCPTESYNDTYPSPRYSNGSNDNMQLNISNLTIGQIYYLIIDGTGGTISPFYIESSNCASCSELLPVELISFDAICAEKSKKIVWRTATETNNDYFLVEKSIDAVNWQPIGKVNGAGNANSVSTYSIFDQSSTSEITYYRIVQVDFDGAKEVLGPIVSECKPSSDGSSVEFRTNYANESLDIIASNFQNDIANVMITDMVGKIVYNTDFEINSNRFIQIDLSSFSSKAMYMVQFKCNEVMKSYKLIKR